MDCERCRTAVSARLDGEPEDAPTAATDAHLEQCASCRAWQAEASALTRRLRVRPAATTPDLVSVVMSAAPDPAPPRRRRVLRTALGAVAAAQLGLGLAQGLLPALHGHGIAHGHLFNESTAWNLAMAAGLLWVAARDRPAGGMLPVLSVFLVVLAGFSVHDLSSGAVTVGRVASHGLLALGLGLLYATERTRDGRRPAACRSRCGGFREPRIRCRGRLLRHPGGKREDRPRRWPASHCAVGRGLTGVRTRRRRCPRSTAPVAAR